MPKDQNVDQIFSINNNIIIAVLGTEIWGLEFEFLAYAKTF